jgi:hypothetical protein
LTDFAPRLRIPAPFIPAVDLVANSRSALCEHRQLQPDRGPGPHLVACAQQVEQRSAQHSEQERSLCQPFR